MRNIIHVFDSYAFKGDIAAKDMNLFPKKTENTEDVLIKHPRSSFKKVPGIRWYYLRELLHEENCEQRNVR
jgi:hypothetical protein